MDLETLKRELGVDSAAKVADALGLHRTYLHDFLGHRRKMSVRMARALEEKTGRKGLVDQVLSERGRA